MLERFKRISKKDSIGPLKIKTKDFTDGYKFTFADDYWVMFRISGTEPVIRCYFEANSHKKLSYLIEIVKKVFYIKD